MWRGISDRISNMAIDAATASRNLDEKHKKNMFTALTDMFTEWEHLGKILPGFCDIFACHPLEEIKEEEKKAAEGFEAIKTLVKFAKEEERKSAEGL